MNWQNALILLLFAAIFLPWLLSELRISRRTRETFHPDPVARKHRAVVRRGFKSRAGIKS